MKAIKNKKLLLIWSMLGLSVATIIVAPTTVILLENSSVSNSLEELKSKIEKDISDKTIVGTKNFLPTDLTKDNIEENIKNLPSIPNNGLYSFSFSNETNSSNGGSNFNGTIKLDITISIKDQNIILKSQTLSGFLTSAAKNFSEITAKPFNNETILPDPFFDKKIGLPPSNIFQMSSTVNIKSYLITTNDEKSVKLTIYGQEPSDNAIEMKSIIIVSGFISKNNPQALANIAISNIENLNVNSIVLKTKYKNKFDSQNISNDNLTQIINPDFKNSLLPKDVEFSIAYSITSREENYLLVKIIVNIMEKNEVVATSETTGSVKIFIKDSIVKLGKK